MGVPRSACPPTTRRSELAALLALAAAGCAALGGDLAPAKASWQGARYDEVVREWGAPARSAPPAFTWVSESTRRLRPGVGVVFGTGSGGTSGGVIASLPFGDAGEPVRCSRTFTFRDGAVAEQTWLGQSDYCSTFSRGPR